MTLRTCLRALTPLLLSLVVGACGDSGDDGGSSPSGAGSSGGKGGQGGASGVSGQAGASGSGAGSGGSAGAQSGGTAGASAGQGGDAGQAGSSEGGSAGENSGGTAQGGEGGSGGSAAGEAGSSGSSAGQGGEGGGGSAQGGSSGSSGQAGSSGGPACKPPDMLVVLDRTLTMHATPEGEKPIDAPDYKTSKWYQAVTAIEKMVTPPADATLRFGLELWPKDSGGCVMLAEQVTGSKSATNTACEPGEVVIPPALNTGAQIQSLLDPATTSLCFSTPTGEALITARNHLKQNVEEGREQYVVLVTDGADWANTCPDPDPLAEVQKLRAEGIKTFIVGFSATGASTSGVGLEFLNDMACAGGTAKGFPGTCKQDAQGNYVALDSKASPLFLQADNGAQLTASLQSVAGSLCCGCETQCDAPDVLFALDRTLTMHATPEGTKPVDAPDYASSKWSQALSGIKKVVNAQDQQFRFGLELWPRDPGAGACVTLAEQVTGSKSATNTACEPGEVVVPPALNTGATISSKLDPKTATLCFSTPTGEALITASTYLTSNITPGRAQYVVLVTDGADWANTCPDPDPLLRVQQLAASGIKTFVVGFFGQGSAPGGVGISFLNDMACAGQTAKDFAITCKQGATGYTSVDPSSTVPLFLGAEDSNQLEGVLVGALDSLGCKLLSGPFTRARRYRERSPGADPARCW